MSGQICMARQESSFFWDTLVLISVTPASSRPVVPTAKGASSTSYFFFLTSRSRHTRLQGDWSSDVCSSDLVDAIGRQHHRERKVAPRETLGEAQEVGRDSRLLTREQSSGAPEPHRDLVGDEMDVEAIAKLAGAVQVFRVVHGHSARALHQRLDDERRGFRGMPLEVLFDRLCAAARILLRCLARLGQTPVRRRYLRTGAKERSVGVAV